MPSARHDDIDRLLEAGAFDEAIAAARRACEATPSVTTTTALATLLRRRGHCAESVAVLRAAVAEAPDTAALWNHLGLALRNDGDFAGALEAFRHGAALAPTDAWAETNVLFALMRQGVDASALFEDGRARGGLGIFCDRYPFLYGFLHKEYSSYLRHFADARVFTLGRDVFTPYDTGQYARHLGTVAERYPDILDRVHQVLAELDTPGAPGAAGAARLRPADGIRHALPRHAYCFFLMNVDLFRPLFEAWDIPFTFTLEPGGGFILNDPGSDARLRAAVGSPQFRTVIVQQPTVRDYLRRVIGVPEDRIAFIPGVMPDTAPFEAAAASRRRPGVDKDTLDVAFTGSLYAPGGRDKGFDLFVEAARALAPRLPQARFHVIGNFPEALGAAAPLIFHGRQPQTWLAEFYRGVDVLVAPNRPWQISHGSIDAFPVNTCVEAAAAGVAIAASDPLGNNVLLAPGDWLDITGADGPAIAEALLPLLADPPALIAAQERHRAAWSRAFGDERQVQPRLRHMEALLAAAGGASGDAG